MKKLFMWLSVAAMAVGAIACSKDDTPEKNKLEAPVMAEPVVTATSATLSWKACANADTYYYTLNDGQQMVTQEPSVKIENLTPETTYVFKVWASKDNSELFENSDVTELTFTTPKQEAPQVKSPRIKMFADDWDKWYYEWNDNGTVKRVYRTADGTENGALDREWKFAYDGNTLTVTGKNDWTMTLNDKGYVSKLVDGENVYEYAYDDNGYMTQATCNGSVVSNMTIENGNITKWSKMKDGAEVWKLHTYGSTPNTGERHCIYSEEAGFGRWIAETGLFGKANAMLHTSNQWDYSDSGSTFDYEFDANGFVTREKKKGSDWEENYYYTYM